MVNRNATYSWCWAALFVVGCGAGQPRPEIADTNEGATKSVPADAARITVIRNDDSSDVEAGKANVVFEYAP